MMDLKKNEEVLVYSGFSSKPDLSYVEGFFNDDPVVDGIVFRRDGKYYVPVSDKSDYARMEKMTDEHREAMRLRKALDEFSSLHIYDDLSKYNADDFYEVIALHKKILERNGGK